jgi:solute carrier family 25 phosphate transporter 3
MAGEENAKKYKDILYLSASASAEVLADIALCPWEAVKVRIQTDDPRNRKFPTTLRYVSSCHLH